MAVLFIISKSPFKRTEPLLYLKLAKQNDAVIFIQDGVIAAQGGPEEFRKELEEASGRGVEILFLKEDLEARGLQTDKKVVDYDGFLNLIETKEKVVH